MCGARGWCFVPLLHPGLGEGGAARCEPARRPPPSSRAGPSYVGTCQPRNFTPLRAALLVISGLFSLSNERYLSPLRWGGVLGVSKTTWRRRRRCFVFFFCVCVCERCVRWVVFGGGGGGGLLGGSFCSRRLVELLFYLAPGRPKQLANNNGTRPSPVRHPAPSTAAGGCPRCPRPWRRLRASRACR